MDDLTIRDDRPRDPVDEALADHGGGAPPPPPGDVGMGDEEPLPEPGPALTEAQVRDSLDFLGDLLHGWIGDPREPTHWRFTASELGQLAPPLTTMINRHAVLARVARRSPEAAVAFGLLRYGRRNLVIARALAEEPEEPEEEGLA